MADIQGQLIVTSLGKVLGDTLPIFLIHGTFLHATDNMQGSVNPPRPFHCRYGAPEGRCPSWRSEDFGLQEANLTSPTCCGKT